MEKKMELIDIHRAEKIAQDRAAASMEWDKSFTLVGPMGAVACEWLDPYFGFFTAEGQEGFMMTRSVPSNVKVLMAEDANDEIG
jgi:hypothetical protein